VLTPKAVAHRQDQDDVVLLPISTAMQKVLGANKANAQAVGSLTCRPSAAAMDSAIEEMEALLRERHRILPAWRRLHHPQSHRGVPGQETSAQVMSILLGAIARYR